MKWLLLGLGAYVLYEYLYGTQAVTSSASTGGTTVTTTPVSSAPSASVAPTKVGVNASALQSIAGGATALTADQWNYFYSKLTGVHQTADLFTSGSRGQVIDVNTYLARRATAGLGGGHSVQSLTRYVPDANTGRFFRGM